MTRLHIIIEKYLYSFLILTFKINLLFLKDKDEHNNNN